MALPKEQREARVAELKRYWEPLWSLHGINANDVQYYPKSILGKSGADPYITLFRSELNSDLYTEAVDFSYNQETDRKLMKLQFNPHALAEYEEVTTNVGQQWRVPAAELIEIVQPPSAAFSVGRLPEIPRTATLEGDCPVSELTGKDWACIHLRFPASGKDWLNRLIIESNK